MSQENVEAFKRAVDAGNRGDVEAGMLKELDPAVEWHPVLLASLEAEATVYRGHDGVREWFERCPRPFLSAISMSTKSGTWAIDWSRSAVPACVAKQVEP